MNLLRKKISRALDSPTTNILRRSGPPSQAKEVCPKILSLSPEGTLEWFCTPTKYEEENQTGCKLKNIVPTVFPCDSTLPKLSKENYLTFGSRNVKTYYWLLTVSTEIVTDPTG